jgi:isopenicillin-N N-acyltransferase-like protein
MATRTRGDRTGRSTGTARPTRFPEFEVAGAPRELGRQLGEACREQVQAFVEMVVDRFNKGRTRALDVNSALGLAHDCIPVVERYSPDLIEELRGIAEGARVTADQAMLLNVRNQLRAAGDGCTSVVVEGRSTASGNGLAGQNWDNDPATDPFSVVLARHPAGKPSTLNFTRPGEIGYMGFNSAGIGILMNAMPGRSRRRGVPWYFIVRRIYEQDSLEGTVAAAESAERAISANAAMITPQGAADLEVMTHAVRVLRGDARGRLVHTNHCVHPDLLEINDEHRNDIYGQSFERRDRASALLDREEGAVGVETLRRVLSDHDGYPTSICRHPNPDPATGWQRSVVSMIVEPAEGRMYLSRGNPCERPYETYEL